MASRYQTGIAASPSAVLDQLSAFLVAQGWSLNYNAAEGTGKRVHASKSGTLVSLRSASAESNVFNSQTGSFTGLGLNIATSYSAASAWYAQPGAPASLTVATYESVALPMKAGLTSYAFHIFDDGSDNVVLVVEADTGIFSVLGFGLSVNKVGTWTGGAYFYGRSRGASISGSASISAERPLKSAGTAYLRASVDGASWCIHDTTPSSATALKMTAATSFSSGGEYPASGSLADRGVSLITSEASLVPTQLLVNRSGGGWSFLGALPSLYCTSAVGKGFAAGSTYARGAEQYVLFPNFAVKK